MKKYLYLAFCLIFLAANLSTASEVTPNCTYNGVPLYGRVRVVENFEDFKVKVVDNFEDLKVRKVHYFPNSCGRWEFVNSFEDFKIKYVDNFEDFKIRFVNSFEGL